MPPFPLCTSLVVIAKRRGTVTPAGSLRGGWGVGGGGGGASSAVNLAMLSSQGVDGLGWGCKAPLLTGRCRRRRRRRPALQGQRSGRGGRRPRLELVRYRASALGPGQYIVHYRKPYATLFILYFKIKSFTRVLCS